MKKHDAGTAERSAAFTTRHICNAVLAGLLLISTGCASQVTRRPAPPPETVAVPPQKTSPRSDAAPPGEKPRKEPADPRVAALVALLKSKGMINDEEAARLTGQTAVAGTDKKGIAEKPAADGIREVDIGHPGQPTSESKKARPEEIEKKEGVSAGQEWTERVRFGGDIRLRSESDRVRKDTSVAVQPAEPVPVERQKAPSGSDAAPPIQQRREEPADQGIGALVALLKSKNVISEEEASRLTGQPLSTVAEKETAAISEEGGQEQIDRTTARAIELVMFDIQDQVKKQVHEELAREMKVREKVQIETITASVTEEVKKNLPEQVKAEPGKGTPATASEKAEIDKVDQKVTGVMEQVAELKNALPEWTRRLRLFGDIRLRYEYDSFDKDNYRGFTKIVDGTDTRVIRNTWSDDSDLKYRARLGLEAKITDQLNAVFRLSSGNTSNPVSTNSLLGDYNNKDNVVFDLAYMKWNPWDVLTLYGGRMPNPWFSSEIVWDSDLNFEGVALNVRKPIFGPWTSFLTAGAFPLSDKDSEGKDKWLYAGQVGLEKKDVKGISAKLGAAYYYFDNITGVLNPNPLDTSGPTNWSAPQFQQTGNTLFYIDPANSFKVGLASEFKELNLTGNLDFGFWDPVHVVLLGDYVKNFGFSKSDVSRRTGRSVSADTYGYQLGLSVGYPDIGAFGRWRAFLNYRYLGADAVVDAFTDSDFHLGGTNAKGWVLGTEFGLFKNTWLTFRWMTGDEISGPPLAIDVLQLDFNARF